MSLDELIAGARGLVERGETPACQVAVARENELVAFETFGAADDETRFCVFSATKPIVASAVWVLIGHQLLDVSKPVAHYVPEFATNGKEVVTVEQVLLHTAGFPNAPMDPVEGADAAMRVKHFTEWDLEWEPGTRFEYHGLSAHWVLAELIERLSGIDFRDFVERTITQPLNLPRVLGIEEEDQDNMANGSRIGEPLETDTIDALLLNTPAVRAAGIPGGGAFMTAATMARFYQALLHNSNTVWDAEILDDVRTNIRCTFPDPLMNVGVNRSIGLVIAGDDGLHQFRYAMFGEKNSPRAFGHSGVYGQVAWADPETGISYALLKNGWNTDLLGDALKILPLSNLAAAL
jgi:CubicO group peptidase (beta-lactamase class C family)